MSLEKAISFDEDIRNQRNNLPNITKESEADRLFEQEVNILEKNGLISVSDSVSSIMANN